MKHADLNRWDKPSRAWKPKHAKGALAVALNDMVTGVQNAMRLFTIRAGAGK